MLVRLMCSKGQQFETECLRQNEMIMQKHGGLLSVSTTKELSLILKELILVPWASLHGFTVT